MAVAGPIRDRCVLYLSSLRRTVLSTRLYSISGMQERLWTEQTRRFRGGNKPKSIGFSGHREGSNPRPADPSAAALATWPHAHLCKRARKGLMSSTHSIYSRRFLLPLHRPWSNIFSSQTRFLFSSCTNKASIHELFIVTVIDNHEHIQRQNLVCLPYPKSLNLPNPTRVRNIPTV